MRKLETIARFIRDHGFRVEITETAVNLWIPYTNGASGDMVGEDRFTVATMAQARETLGY